MRTLSRAYAERGVQMIALALAQQPPVGVTAAFVQHFFGKFRIPLIEQLATLLDALADEQEGVISIPADTAPGTTALTETPLDDVPPDEWSASARSKANVAAIKLLASGVPIGPAERQTLMRYSGSGGLSIDSLSSQVPQEWVPELQGQVHEFYTPTRLCREVARVLRPLLSGIRFGQEQDDKPLWALEPSAGIGRFIHACSGPGFERLRWTAVEYSHVSAKLLAAIRPDITVFEGPFEKWVADNEPEAWGQIGLLLSNPPYGKRGGTITLDPDPRYREPLAYPYFTRRGLDLLGPSGIGVLLIPYGFLSSKMPRFVELRRKVLLRHHLMAAFRLPSELFPGANLVTDLLFFRARGGELDTILGSDAPIVEGRYFEEFPHHILGRVIGEQSEDDPEPTSKRPRRGYEIAGTFTVLPPFVERPGCASCWVKPVERPERKAVRRPKKEDLPPYLQAAVTLGDRVAFYLKHYGSSDADSARKAALLFPELHEALLAWQAGRRADDLPPSPYADRELQRSAKDFSELVSFLSAFENDGSLAQAFAHAPSYEPRYKGSLDDVVGQAQFLYGTRRRFKTDAVIALRRELQAPELSGDALDSQLYAAGWCQDGSEWLPEADYYTGELWPKYRRAKERSAQGDANAERQATRLYQLIDPPPLSEIAAEPRMPWVPLDVLRPWLQEFTGASVPALVREGALLRMAGKSYGDTAKAPYWLRAAIGYINHDFSLFEVPYAKAYLDELRREESAGEALDRARLQYAAKAIENFRSWLLTHPEAAQAVEVAYGQLFRGYILPTYPPKDLDIARWRGDIVLRPHQQSAALRLLHNGGGLEALDVGVGKTLTGIGTFARMRQEGRARRILAVLPNSIMLKWEKEILRALPDYRVLMIGTERYIGRGRVLKSRIDSEAERALKYRQFQAGEFDVALVTYSMFGRTGLREETLRAFAAATPPLQRELGLRARNALSDVEADQDKKRKRSKKKTLASIAAVRQMFGAEAIEKASPGELDRLRAETGERLSKQREVEEDRLRGLIEKLADRTERDRAAFSLELERWIAEMTEGSEQDPGIYWEDLKIDLLILDEAQNYKNLWSVEQREGGVPKYLGAIQEGSLRAWNFALRAFEVRQRNGGAGVVLLSATPAKNSPLEYFTLLGYVDGDAWYRLGITDPEVFIDRYLRLEMRTVIEPDLSTKRRSVVAGFKNQLELQDIVFRYAEFRTAEEVGLKLPETLVENRLVPMSRVQRTKFSGYATAYRDALKRASAGTDAGARMKALGYLRRMDSVSVHPELDRGPSEDMPPPSEATRQAAKEMLAALESGKSWEEINQKSVDDAARAAVQAIERPAAVEFDAESEDAMPDTDDTERPAQSTARRKKKPRWTWSNAVLAVDYGSPKINEAARIALSLDNCGGIFFCDSIPVHRWLKLKLVELGILAERIGVLNAEVAPTAMQRQLIAEKFNGVPPIRNERGEIEQEGIPPELDFVIANATAYEGIDLQVRTCVVVHLDLPWEPATLQQRNGRAVRQGNRQSVIKIIYVLSERSTDALRLSMITGKLGWMKDLLQSADRETNNPAAQSEMSPDEMMLYLSSEDPEAAKAAVEQLRREQETRALESTRKSAWGTLRTLASRAVSLKRLTDPAELAHAHKTLEEAKQFLAQIPAEIWPWGFLVPIAERGTPMVFGSRGESDFALWEGARFYRSAESGEAMGFEVGRIQLDSLGVRRFKEATFEPETITGDGWAVGLASSARPEDYAQVWPDREDREGLSQPLRYAIDELRYGEINRLGLRHAPESWRTWLWQTHGADIVKQLGAASQFLNLRIPLLDGEALTLVPPGSHLMNQAARVLPFTEAGWQRFLALAPQSGLKWSELNAAADAWWGRGFPRGLLSKAEANPETE